MLICLMLEQWTVDIGWKVIQDGHDRTRHDTRWFASEMSGWKRWEDQEGARACEVRCLDRSAAVVYLGCISLVWQGCKKEA